MASATPPESVHTTPPPVERKGQGQSQGERQGQGLDTAVKKQVTEKLGEQQQAAAAGLGQFAQALRKAAHEGDAERNPTLQQVADRAAEGLDRFSQTLRSKDFDTMVRDVESFARSQPAVFLGAAVAVGFLAIRFLKSSNPES